MAAAVPQRFPLPNLPFRREIHSGCAIGTSISCTAQAFQAKPKSFTVELFTAKDTAILVIVPIAKNGQITASARVDGKFTSEVEKPIFLPIQMKFTLRLHITQYVIEIYFNNNHMMDFVHRVSPSEIKGVLIEGPLIVDEVVFTPPQGACLDPLPTYEQATGSSVNPVPELEFMNIGSSTVTSLQPPAPGSRPTSAPSLHSLGTPTPIPALPQIGFFTSPNTQPMAKFPSQPPPAPGFVASAPEINTERFDNGEQVRSYSALYTTAEQATKSEIYENVPPHYVPTPSLQSQVHPFSNTPMPVATSSSSNNQQLGNSQILQTPQPVNFPSAVAPIQPYQPPAYGNSPQAVTSQPILPQSSYPQQAMPQPYASTSQYPHAYSSQQPYVHPQYPTGVPGMQVHSQYTPYQQPPPFQYPPPAGPYSYGYVPHHYGTYPVIYGSTCHRYRRSSSCCSD